MRSRLASIAVLLTITFAGSAGALDLYLVAAGNNLGAVGEPPLRYAEKDAGVIASILQRLGGIPAQNTVVVLGEDAKTFRKVVLDMNARIRTIEGGAGPESVLIVYYSGHADASGLHLGETTLVFDELKTMMAGSPAAVRLLVIDSCRSGGVTRVKGARPAEEFEINMVNRISAEGLAIITSSAAGEDSYESEQLKASFFSHHLANALRGAADQDRDGRVTLDEAYRYTYRQTLRSSGRTLNLQHPTYHYDIKGKGNLTLTRLENDRNRSGLLAILKPGFYLVIEGDEDGPIAAEVSVGQEGTKLVLPSGSYFVQKRSQAHYLEYQIELGPGDEVKLDAAPHRTVEYARLLRKGGGDQPAVAGVYLLGAGRGQVVEGLGATSHLVVGGSLDFPWLSFGLRLSFAQGFADASDQLTRMMHTEYGVGLTVKRYVDLPGFSLSFGFLVELARHSQEFRTTGLAPDRTSWSFGFGGLVGVEVELIPALYLIAEGGPLTQVLKKAVTEVGAEAASETSSPFTWWAAGGLGWRF